MMMTSYYGVCLKGKYLAIISTTKEKENVKEDLKVAFDLIGDIEHEFYIEEDQYESKEFSDGIYITSSLDSTSHFESAARDVEKIYEAI